MINLAGVKDCDTTIANELKRSGISSVPYTGRLREVPSHLEGRLGPFKFHRAWYYWVVTGPMPLNHALDLYENPVGRTDIRVAGHCGCPPPEDPWVKWYTDKGEVVVSTKNMEEINHWLSKDPAECSIARVMHEAQARRPPYIGHDNPAEIGAMGYVNSYHIDSELGLYIFCNKIREAELNLTTEPPSWWSVDD